MILNGFLKKIIFEKKRFGTRDPPPYMANAIKNFHVCLILPLCVEVEELS